MHSPASALPLRWTASWRLECARPYSADPARFRCPEESAQRQRLGHVGEGSPRARAEDGPESRSTRCLPFFRGDWRCWNAAPWVKGSKGGRGGKEVGSSGIWALRSPGPSSGRSVKRELPRLAELVTGNVCLCSRDPESEVDSFALFPSTRVLHPFISLHSSGCLGRRLHAMYTPTLGAEERHVSALALSVGDAVAPGAFPRRVFRSKWTAFAFPACLPVTKARKG